MWLGSRISPQGEDNMTAACLYRSAGGPFVQIDSYRVGDMEPGGRM